MSGTDYLYFLMVFGKKIAPLLVSMAILHWDDVFFNLLFQQRV